MKIGIISDTHSGITKYVYIKNMLRELSENNPDIIIHAGDYNGGVIGYKKVRSTIKLMREIFPTIPILTVLGNHDYWVKGKHNLDIIGTFFKPSQKHFENNYNKIIKIFKQYNIHFFDEDGIFEIDDLIFIGHTLWYNKLNPPTNDKNYLPLLIDSADANGYLKIKSETALQRQMDILNNKNIQNKEIIVVSHFPIINDQTDIDGFNNYGGNEKISQILRKFYNIKYFIEGHSHKLKKGPNKFNCGSDYYHPRYLILEI